MNMFDISWVSGISVLHLYGEVSQLEAELIERLIASLKKSDHKKILLDLAQVDHVNLQAVQRLSEQAKRLQQEEGDLKLVAVGEKSKQMLQFTGADQYLKDYSSLADAILSFLKMPGSLMDVEKTGSPVQAKSDGRSRVSEPVVH